MPKKQGREALRKVTPENYQVMKNLLASGLTQADLRRAFKLSPATTFLINRLDTYDEYHEYILNQSQKAKAKAKAKVIAAERPEEESVEKPVEEPQPQPQPAFVPNFYEANQERIIELLEQILKKLDCAEMVVSSDDGAPKRRGLFSFGSKAPF
jgi:hypothetical protein